MPSWRSLVEASKYQIYISRSLDPYLNLSIEHFLLQKSPPHSTVLFLYVNRPCVVIGRNQNPWLEVDLKLLRQRHATGGVYKTGQGILSTTHGSRNVELVRRRSGGGTVFHDEGNVNYSVICPQAAFTRDKHAEMVTQAIRKINSRARVNERHDIVLDQGSLLPEQDWPRSLDMHKTRFHPSSKDSPPLKVSGSAYKMTRQRSLHHGTCLLASADLPGVSKLLRSPARPFIKAKGVESVRSPIGNVHGEAEVSHQAFNDTFQKGVMKAFCEMYKINKEVLEGISASKSQYSSDGSSECTTALVGDDLSNIEDIRAGIEELKSPKWIYGQTPQFTLSSHAIEEDDRERPTLLQHFPASARVYLKIKSGLIISSIISLSSDSHIAKEEIERFDSALKDRSIESIRDIGDILREANAGPSTEIHGISRWLNEMFGKAVESRHTA